MIAHNKTRPGRKLACTLALLLGCAVAAWPVAGVQAQPGEETPVEAAPVADDGDALQPPPRPEEEAAPASAVKDPWEDFFPPADRQFDWIQLTSGEWLKGELKGLYSYKLEFESDELDTLSFDWEDIRRIRTAGPKEVGYEDPDPDETRLQAFRNRRVPKVAFGQLTLIGDTATIATSPTATTIKRDQIVSIAGGTQQEADFWSGEVSVGVNARRGNSDLSDANVYLRAERRRAITRFFSDYRASFSRAGNEELSNNHRVRTWFDSFRTSRLYWRVIHVDYFRDRFQNIENQLTVGTGLGYDIIRDARTEWDVGAGVGALYKESSSVELNQDAANTSPALTLSSRFDIELTNRVDYLLNYSGTFADEQNGAYIHSVVTTLSSDITGNLDLDVTLVWDHTAKPRRAEDGTLPDQNDYRLSVSVSYEF